MIETLNHQPEYDDDATEMKLVTIDGSSLRWTPRVEIVKNLVIKRARPTSLNALPGVGKGNVATYILVSVSHGLPVFGFATRPVDWYLYVDGEDDAAEFARRATRIAKALGVEPDDRLHYVEVPFKLNSPARRAELESLLREWSKRGEGLVVYDSAQALFGGNQASGEVGDEVYSLIKSWGQRFNHTPIVIDHAAKGSKREGASASEYGSVFKRARVGTSLYLRQVESLDAQTTLIDLYHPKSNTVVVDTRKGARALVRFTIRFDDPDGPITFEVQHEDVSRIDALGADPVTVKQAAEIWRLSLPQAARELKHAENAHLVKVVGKVKGTRGRLYQVIAPRAEAEAA